MPYLKELRSLVVFERNAIIALTIVTLLTLMVNVLNIWPGYDSSQGIRWFIDHVLNVDMALLEVLDLFILAGAFVTAILAFTRGRYPLFLTGVILLLIFLFLEEISYGTLFTKVNHAFFNSVDGADEGNFHNANFIPGSGLELANLFYILGAPFFLFVFDERMGLLKLREKLRLPRATLTDAQTCFYLVGCLTLPLDGFPNDIEMDQIFINTIYFSLWIMCWRIWKTGEALPMLEPKAHRLFKWTMFSTALAGLRLLIYYHFLGRP